MRTAVTIAMLLIAPTAAIGQKKDPPPPARFGIEADLDVFPQDSPKAALASALKAIDARRYTYLVAQLSEPDFAEKRVNELGSFEAFVKQVTNRLTDDPEIVRELRQFAGSGEVNESGDTATVSHKDYKGRQVFLKKVGSRWYLENRMKPLKG